MRFEWIAAVLAVLAPFAVVPVAGQTLVSFGDPKTPNVLTPGSPFQAERVTKTTLRLQDGSLLVREEHELLGRDAYGRFFDESYQLAAAGKTNHSFVLADPIAKREISWTQGGTAASATPLRATTPLNVVALPLDRRIEAAYFPRGKASVTTEQTGTKTIDGVVCTGTRTVTTVAAGAIGNAEPLQHSEEIWVASDLQIVIAETDASPIWGTRTVTTVSLERTAPPAERFAIPKELTIRDSPMVGLPGFPGSIRLPDLPTHRTESPQ